MTLTRPLLPLICAALPSTTGAVRAQSAAQGSQSQQLELFGVKLKGASRNQLREAFKAGGLRALREDDSYWVDKYNAESVLEGASSLAVGYVQGTKVFAFAEYGFHGRDPRNQGREHGHQQVRGVRAFNRASRAWAR